MKECKTCGRRLYKTSQWDKEGRCWDCQRHPPGSVWKGGTLPQDCTLVVVRRTDLNDQGQLQDYF